MINCCYCCFGMFQLVGARQGEEVKEVRGRLCRAGGGGFVKKGDDRQGSDRMDMKADKKIQRVSEMNLLSRRETGNAHGYTSEYEKRRNQMRMYIHYSPSKGE